jgi:hypothetical protein
MAAPARLVLYGNSVFLAGIKTELGRHSSLELITIEAGLPGAAERIRDLNPCALLFDLSAAQPDFAIPLLRDRPSLVLIGVDACSDEMLVLWPHKERAVNVGDLLTVIGQETTASTSSS